MTQTAYIRGMAKELKTAAISVRVRPSIKTAIARHAAADRRSMAEFVEIILEDFVKRKTFTSYRSYRGTGASED